VTTTEGYNLARHLAQAIDDKGSSATAGDLAAFARIRAALSAGAPQALQFLDNGGFEVWLATRRIARPSVTVDDADAAVVGLP
jgi:hypothetical protein